MIIDFHTHIFPSDVRDNRDEYIRRDPTFAEMYSNPKAKIATAEDLLASMDDSGVDVSVALGFAWQSHDDIVRHNDYLLESAANSGAKIVPFTTINMSDARAAAEIERCAKAGARGLGELRPGNQGWEGEDWATDQLAAVAHRRDLVLLFHVSEPVGHRYPGKDGGSLKAFYDFCLSNPQLKIVGAHVAGGLPFYAGMPEVGKLFSRIYADTAATHLLYSYRSLWSLEWSIGEGQLLFGSDFPLIRQSFALHRLREQADGVVDLPGIVGRNALNLLGPVG